MVSLARTFPSRSNCAVVTALLPSFRTTSSRFTRPRRSYCVRRTVPSFWRTSSACFVPAKLNFCTCSPSAFVTDFSRIFPEGADFAVLPSVNFRVSNLSGSLGALADSTDSANTNHSYAIPTNNETDGESARAPACTNKDRTTTQRPLVARCKPDGNKIHSGCGRNEQRPCSRSC